MKPELQLVPTDVLHLRSDELVGDVIWEPGPKHLQWVRYTECVSDLYFSFCFWNLNLAPCIGSHSGIRMPK